MVAEIFHVDHIYGQSEYIHLGKITYSMYLDIIYNKHFRAEDELMLLEISSSSSSDCPNCRIGQLPTI